MMVEKDDGKIRVRCSGCGKRVKCPAGKPGEAYRCPVCHTTIVAPLDKREVARPSDRELKSFIPKPLPAADRTDGETAGTSTAARTRSQSSRFLKGKHPVEELGEFLMRQTRRATEVSREILTSPSMSDEKRRAKLGELRTLKGVRLREHVRGLLRDLDQRIAVLRHSAGAEAETSKRAVARLQQQRDQFVLYLDVMFQLQTPGPNGPGVKPDTPAAEVEPPSTP